MLKTGYNPCHLKLADFYLSKNKVFNYSIPFVGLFSPLTIHKNVLTFAENLLSYVF